MAGEGALSAFLDEHVLTTEEAAAEVIRSARRNGGVVGLVVDEDALMQLARRLVWESGVSVGQEIGSDG